MMLAAVTLASLVLPLVQAPGADSQADDGNKHVVTYYYSLDDKSKFRTETYYGVPTTEYNPEYWDESKDNCWAGSKVSATSSMDQEVKLGYSRGNNASFVTESGISITSVNTSGGSGLYAYLRYNNNNLEWYNPVGEKTGSVSIEISYTVNQVFAGWIWIDGSGSSHKIDPGDVIDLSVVPKNSDGVIELYATWATPDIFLQVDDFKLSGSNQTWKIRTYLDYDGMNNSVVFPVNNDDVDERYTRIVHVGTDINNSLGTGTYRGANGSDTSVNFGKVTLTGHVIIDNMTITSSDPGSNHGDGNGSGIFAKGYTLIMGTGLSTNATQSNQALQVFGGADGGTVVRTKVLIHSGVYYNIVAGGYNGDIGSTYLVMRGGTVLDTVVGGNSGSGSINTVDNTAIYIVGGTLVADSYEEDQMGTLGNIPIVHSGDKETRMVLNESSILTGGSNNGEVSTTNVYISGDAVLWDIQGGGRRGGSTTGTANVEVSGNATIRHVLCGSITDGINSENSDKQCVKTVKLTVKDGAKVGSVFGAGYDTYYEANSASMFGTDSSISIDIEGGTVGYVYGGGYRGTIGSETNPVDSISIEISGGTVLYDVFGGGRGGVDKILHQSDGSIYSNRDDSVYSHQNSTGNSKVYVETITIDISGGTVGGNVYGGGESVPVLSGSFYGIDNKGDSVNYTMSTSNDESVASVYASEISVNVSGGTVEGTLVDGLLSGGNVYGAGKGVDTGDADTDPKIYAIDAYGKWHQIDWFKGQSFTLSSADHSGFASVTLQSFKESVVKEVTVTVTGEGPVTGSVYGGGQNGKLNGDAGVSVGAPGTDGITNGVVLTNVFGGGQNGEVTGITSVTTYEGSSVEGSVYGGGQNAAVGTKSSSTVNVVIGGNVGADVFGGGQEGAVPDSTEVTIQGTSSITGSVYGGGEKAAVPGTSTVEILAGSVVGVNVYGGGESAAVGTTSADNVSVIIGGEVQGNVYGGGENGVITGITSVTTLESSSVGGSVYGGGQNAAVGTGSSSTSSTVNVVIGGNVGANVFGGGQNGAVPDSTEVTIQGTSSVTGSVYGGGEKADVGGSTSVNIAGSVGKDVYGGGCGIDSDPSVAIVRGNTSVTLFGTVNNNVFGGGQFGYVGGSTTVITENGSVVGGSVYGGGAGSASSVDMAYVGQTTTVRIAGKVSKNVFGGGSSARVGSGTNVNITGTVGESVYGGGEGAEGNNSIASVPGDTNVSVTGKVGGSVYGGGKIGSVGGTEVLIMDADVVGSVYGGGSGGKTPGSAVVSGGTEVEVRSSKVSGDVYGGGRGVSEEPSTASVAGSVTIQIIDSQIDGSVYGGGMYGAVGPTDDSIPTGSITVNVTGSGTVVGGNIHAGGLGEADTISTNVYSRTLTVNGPSIGGSVYGGSRFGDDNYIDGSVIGTSTSTVNIISGNLLYGSSGNVYGAGYRGHAGMDTNVNIGAATGGIPVTGVLRVNSVYGGPSVGSSDSEGAETVLMTGDSSVSIAGSAGVGQYTEIRVSGDVFGSGDYCEIDGHSSISFDGFDQGTAQLQSIQKADEVRIVSSTINITGNLDGSNTSGSPRLALNMIGELVLDNANGTPTSLSMDAATSQISSYVSMYSYGSVPGSDSASSSFNSIRMNGGMIFSVLGTENHGLGMGEVSGVTLFASDTNDYYGAFVIAGRTHLVAGNTEFYVQTDEGLVPADHSDFSYTFSDNPDCQVRAWFIQGAYSVEGTGIIQEGQNDNGTSVSVSIPKIRKDSNIWFVGYYVNASAPGSLNIVGQYSSGSGGKIDVAVKVGAGDSAGTLQFDNGNGLDLYTQGSTAAMSTNSGDGNVVLPFDVKVINTKFPMSGFLGTITVHLAEESGGIMTDVFDVEISLYLRLEIPETGDVSMSNDVVMSPTQDGYTGELDIYLPILDNNATGAYHITGITLPEQTGVSIYTVPTNLTKNGWFERMYEYDPWKCEESLINTDVFLGYGGVYSPVIKVQIHSGLDIVDGQSIELSIEVRDENTGQTKHYDVSAEINLVSAPTVTVTVWDYYLNVVNGSISSDSPWTESEMIFSLEMLYGESLSGVYVAYMAGWNGETMEAYYESVMDSLVKTTDGVVITGTEAVMSNAYKDQGYKISTVEDFLKEFMQNKPPTAFNGGEFDYNGNGAAWYDGVSRHSQFNMGSPVTNDADIYGGYSIVITIKVKMPSGDDNHVTVNPSQLFPGAPGTIFNLEAVSISLSDGYSVDHWEDQSGQEIQNPGTFTAYGSTTIYAVVEKIEYKVTVIFQDEDEDPIAGCSASAKPYNFDTGPVTVTLTLPNGYHVLTASGALGNGGNVDVSVITDENGIGLEFNSVAGDVTITVTLSDTYYVTVEMPSGWSDNDLYGISYDGSGTITLVQGGDQKSIRFPVSELFEFTVKGLISAGGTGHDVTVSLWDGSEWIGLYSDSIGGIKYSPTTMESNVTLYLYASIELELIVPDNPGYHYEITYLDPRGVIAVGETDLHRGDSIVLTCDAGHGFSSSFLALGVTGGGNGTTVRTYTAQGTQLGTSYGVQFGTATVQILTITFTVYFGDDPTVEPMWTLTVDGAIAQLKTDSKGDGYWTYTMSGEPRIYTFATNFGGVYQDVTLSNISVSTDNSSFVIYAVPVIQDEGVPEEPVDVDHAHAVTTVGSVSRDHTVVGIEGNYVDETKVIEGLGKFTLSGNILTVTLDGDVPENLLVGTILLDFADGSLLVAFTIVPTVHGAGPGEVVIS